MLGAVIALVVLLAGAETADLLRRAGLPVQPPVLVGLALLAVAEAAVAMQGLAWALPGWMALVVLVGAASALGATDVRSGILRWAGVCLGGLYVGTLAFLLRITVTVEAGAAEGPLAAAFDPGRAWLLVLVLGVWAYDTAAYVAGRVYARGHFFTHISPHKTWSGAVGGAAGAVVACAALGLSLGRPLEGAGLGILLAFAAPLGDLAESMIKRAAGVKDSGQLIPGHGGMLDRVDSFTAAAPLAWLYLVLVGIA